MSSLASSKRFVSFSNVLQGAIPFAQRARHVHLQLQEEKIELENALEAESESHVNRLSRELSALRLAQQLASQQNGTSPGLPSSSVNGDGTQSPNLLRLPNPLAPSSEDMLDAMRRENEQLRNRLVDTEREYIRISRLNEIYREELIQHRRRVRAFIFYIFPAWHKRFLSGDRSLLPVRTAGRQPDRLVGARPLLPADSPALVLERIIAFHVRHAPTDRSERRARLAERRHPAPALAGPSTPGERNIGIDDAPVALALIRLGLAVPLPVLVHPPGQLRDRRDDAAVVLCPPHTADDHSATTTVVSVRPAPVAFVVVCGPGFACGVPREQVAPWVYT